MPIGLPKRLQQFDTKAKHVYPWVALLLIMHMFYKVVLDRYTGGIFNVSLLLAVCVMFVLYFTKAYTGLRSRYVLVSFVLYAVYIALLTVTDGDFCYVTRGVYEYGFYQAILFAAAFLTSRISKEKLVRNVVLAGFPFVLVGAICAFTYQETPSTPMYGDTAMRIVGLARSPLSQGMLSGTYCLFALAQAKASGKKWYYLPFAVGVFSLIASGSRGPMVAFAAAVLAYLLLACISRRGKEALKIIVVAAGILTVLAVLFFTSDLHFQNETINTMYLRIKRIVDWSGDAGNVGRLDTWRKWVDIFLENFWFGIGMSRTGSWGPNTLGVTESGLLRHLVEIGIIGSVLYYNLIASCVVSALTVTKKAKYRLNSFTLLNIAILVLVLVEDMVLQITEEITVAFFLWWALGALMGSAPNSEPETAAPGSQNRKTTGETDVNISVVVTTYNGSKFIAEQLASILAQTRQPDEVLIFDDCSSDNTAEIVSDFIRKNNLERWSLLVNKENKGWKENFRYGLLAAKGDLVFPCDQDDIWRADKLESCERIMVSHPDIQVLTSNYEKFGDCRQEIVPNSNDKQIVQIEFDGNLFKIGYPGCSYCIRRSFLADIQKNWTPNSPHDATIWRFALLRNGLFAFNDSLILWRVYKTSTYELELKNNHSWEKKRKWLDYAMGVLGDLEAYIAEHQDYQTKRVLRELEANRRFLSLRMNLYDHVNVLTGLKLVGYLKYYAAPIQYLGDWLHAIRRP